MSNLLHLSPISKKRIFLFLTSGIALSTPLPPVYSSVFCITLFLFWLIFLEKEWHSFQLKIALTISLLFWASLLAMVYTKNTEEGLFRIQQKALLLLPLVFGTIKPDWRDEFKWVTTFFVLAVVTACLVCAADALHYFILHNSTERFFSHGLVEFIDIYPYVLALLCLSAILILTEAGIGRWALPFGLSRHQVVIGLISFFSVFIFLLSVKQVILAWIVFVIIYLIKLGANRKFIFIILLSGILLVLLSIFFIPTIRTKLDEIAASEENSIPLDQDGSLRKEWNGIAVRRAVWTCAMDVIQKNFWLGVGTGDGQDELQAAYENRQFYFASRYNRFNTHNQYLQTLVNFGMVGLALWLIAISWFFLRLKTNSLAIYLMSAFLFAMLTESMLETNKGLFAMAFLLSVYSFTPSKGNQFDRI